MLQDLEHWKFFLGGILTCTIILGLLLAYVQRLRTALQENEERFRAIRTSGCDWEILLGTDGRPLWVNAAAQRMTGLTTEEALALPDYPLPLIEEEDQAAVRSALALVEEGGIIDDQLVRVRRPDNSTFRGSLSAQKIFSSKGKALGSRLNIRDVSTLIDYQEAMARKRQLLQSVLDNTSDGVIALNQELRVIFFNVRFLQLWGLSRSFLNEQPTLQEMIHEVCRIGLYPPAEAEALVRRRIEHLIGFDERILLETPRQDGIIVEGFATPLRGIGYLLTYRDVTTQTLATREAQRCHEHYRTLIETVPHGIIECDLNGRILYVNANYGAIVGMAPEQLQGRYFWDALSIPEAAGMMRRRFEQLRDEGHQPGSEIVQMVNSAGASFWRQIDWNFLRDERGAPTGFIAVVTDITERKMTEGKEQEQAAFVQTILDTVPAPIFYKDADGLYLGCNTAFERYLGKSRSEVIGKTVFDLAPPDLAQIYADSDAELLRQGGTQFYETQVLFADGRRHDVLFSKAVFAREDNAPGGLVGAMLDISARKEAEEALRANERKYHAIFDQAFQYTALLDPTGRVLEINRTALDSIGTTLAETSGKFFWETPWWQGDSQEQERIRAAIASCAWGNTLHFETRHTPPDGQEVAIDLSIKPVRDEWGQILYLIPEGRDITKLKRREKMAMLMARGISAPTGADFFPALTRSLVEVLGAEHALIGTLEGDEVSIIAGLSNGIATGPWRYALAGTPCAEVLSRGQICAFPQRVQSLFPADLLLQSMAVEGYAGSPLCTAAGTPLGIMAVLYARPIQDLELIESLLKIFVARAASELERRQTDAILQQSEARYKKLTNEFETIFNGIPDSLTVWSSEMQVLWANASSKGVHGEIIGKNCRELCTRHEEIEGDCEVRRSFRTGAVEEGIHKAQDGRTWGVKAFPLRDTTGAVDRVIRLASDLTERMILREEAARAAHLAALGELAAGMAHEINNPTSLILLEMPILQEVFRDSSEILEEHFRAHGDFSCGGLRYSKMRAQLPAMIAEIRDSAERIRQIVEDLRDFSHPIESNQFKAVDLNEVVRKALGLVANQIKKTTDHFSVIYAPTVPKSLGSLQRLEQVVINLVINACQALPDREGSLTVEAGSWPERQRNFIRVADTGIGILPEHLKLITDPFFTTRRAIGGTGLGLSVSTRIIEEHGGTLHFASVVGGGTTVTIELPMLEPEEQP